MPALAAALARANPLRVWLDVYLGGDGRPGAPRGPLPCVECNSPFHASGLCPEVEPGAERTGARWRAAWALLGVVA